MSIWLGIESATPVGSVAVARDGQLLAEITLGQHTRHAELLLPCIEFVLRAAGVERHELAGIVVGEGPGSFTGVRIAAATARGLALALERPLFAASSLAAVAAPVGLALPGQAVCALFDARRSEVYAGCYRFRADGYETLLEPTAAPLAEVLEQVAPHRPAFVGEGAVRYGASLPGGAAAALPGLPRAAALLWLHALDPERGRIEEAAGWEPSYLRTSGAERGLSV